MGRRTRKDVCDVGTSRNGARDAVAADEPPGAWAPALAPKMKLWIVVADRVKFGAGRAQLLQAIDELGSLRQAAERFGMSYRSAWGYLRELEAAVGVPLLERHVGGGERGGMALTPQGRTFLAHYQEFQRQVDAMVQDQFAACFAPPR